MHVLLVTPSDRREGFEYVYSGRENLGVEYLLAALRATGVEAKSRNENIPGTLLAEDTDLSRHDVIGFSLPFWEYRKRYVESINRIAQRTDALLLIGGHASTIGAKYFLHKCPRLAGVVMGEGEETLVEIVRSLESRGTCEGVPGLMTRSGFEQRRELVELDDLPFPHRDELRQSLDSGLAVQEALVESTRGCTYRCSFCSIPPYYKHAHKKRWRERSVENICAELTQLVNSFPEVNLISFTDDNFMGFNSRFHDRAIRIAEHLHSLREDIVFEVVCRVDAVEPEPFARLAELGMVGVYLGIESGVQRILDAFQKKTTVNQNLRAVQILCDLGVGCDIGFIAFSPGMVLDEVRENLDFLLHLSSDYPVFVHPAAVFRCLREYPTDLGVAALDESQDVNLSRLAGPVNTLYQALDTVWREHFEGDFIRWEARAATRNDDIDALTRQKKTTDQMIEIAYHFHAVLERRPEIPLKDLMRSWSFELVEA